MIVANAVTIPAGLSLSGLMLFLLHISPWEVLTYSVATMLTDKYTIGEVLLKTMSLVFTVLAFAFIFGVNLFSTGAQGQSHMGAVAAVALSLQLDGRVPTLVLLVVICLTTTLVGGLIGALISFLKAHYKANEFLVNMTSTYVALNMMNYLLRTFLRESKGEYPRMNVITRAVWLPTIVKETRLRVGSVVAALVATDIQILLYKTPLGYRIRAVRGNDSAARMSGINSKKMFVVVFFISGAPAGMAGFMGVDGMQHILIQDFNNGVGSAGLGVTILANASPIGIIFASISFDALGVVGNLMGRTPGADMPPSIVDLMQGFAMSFVIISYFSRHYPKNKREKLRLQKGV